MKAINYEENKGTGKLFIEIGILLLVADLLMAAGLWQFISNDWKVAGSGDVFRRAFIEAGNKFSFQLLQPISYYTAFLTALFSFLGNKEEIVPWANLVLQFAGVVCFYRGSRKLFGFLPGLFTAIVSGIVSGVCFTVIKDDPVHMIWLAAGAVYWGVAAGIMLIRKLLTKRRTKFELSKATEAGMENAISSIEELEAAENSRSNENQAASLGFTAKGSETEHAEVAEGRKKTIKFIENPLPVPKKHVKKEMTYAFEPTPEQMHYDLNNYDMNDDYDIKVG